MTRALFLLLLTGAVAAPLQAAGPILLGQFARWAAFRASDGQSCHAIAQPSARKDEPAFVAMVTWPRRGITHQVHVRLRRSMPEADLVIGGARFPLQMAGADGWSRAGDGPRIAARIRVADTLRIEARDHGRYFADTYALTGAPSAIDAAALGCLPR